MHKREIGRNIKEGTNVIFIHFDDLSAHSPALANYVLTNPEEALQLLEVAIEESGIIQKARMRFKALPETGFVKIRNIRARDLNHMITIEGIIRQASDVRPQVVNAKFECPTCGTHISVLQIEKKFREPSRCSCGRKGGFRLLSKEMVDAQRIVIEEAPESLSGGEQPRRIDIFLKEDLVEPKMEEKTTPGSRVRVIGILKEIPIPLQSGGLSTRFGLAIEANNIIPLEETYEELDITDEDEKQIQELALDPNNFEKFTNSVSPSIYGYKEIKQSLVLQLFGGVPKRRSDGTHSRGDIHILLVGDPGVAKSVMLSWMSAIAPKGRYVVGKSSTGAGLTATVVKDEYLKGWSLEAGAIVLSHKGLVCIDELEKMDPQDRSAMHEALEQQTVTISKANVQATLKAETSVLAAANPKYGRFDPYQAVAQQIDIPPTLLNRFDVIFTLRDIPDKRRDEAIAEHVLREHQESSGNSPLDRDLFKKYIAYAKRRYKPKLSNEALETIKKFYVELRNAPVSGDSMIKPIPISARQLTALIRMSEASARSRLSNEVVKYDADRAIQLMKYYLTQVGYDYESKTFDIDRITTGVTSSQRNKILVVKEALIQMESRLGKLIPIEELEKELENRLRKDEIDEILDQLAKAGDIFRPRRGFIQRM
jgi:replicative DNA helicase Mcm